MRDLSGGRAPSEDLSGYRVVHPGDLVVNKLWARFGAYGVSRFQGIISPAYWVLRLDRKRVHPAFLHHLLRSSLYLSEIGRLSRNQPPNGFDLSWEQFRLMRLPLPPIDRQREVADVLDAQMARLDGLIAAAERQKGLYSELIDVTMDHLALEGRPRTAED